MIRSHSKTISPLQAQPTPFAKAESFLAVAPVKSSHHSQRIAIHHRSPTLEIRISKISRTPAQTAIAIGPAKSISKMIRRRPGPAQSSATAQVSFTSQAVAEPLTSQKTEKDTFAALPRELPQNLPVDRDILEVNLNGLRGLFTGQVRQRIANAKYYPRMARRRGIEGRPIIAFTLDSQGRLTKVDLAETSGYQLLDRAALDAVQQGAPYPEIPAPLKMNSFQFKLPISFVLK
jgi:TonB family protein